MSPDLEIQLIAVVTAVAAAVPGTYLVLRRMALVSDAISHAILPGIVVAFFLTGDLASPWLVFGAAVAVCVLGSGVTLMAAAGGRLPAAVAQAASRAADLPKPLSRAATTMLAASRLTSHSHGPGNVSSKSFTTLETMAKLMIARGAWNALNLDGGSSATMVLEGETPVPRGGNRAQPGR